MYILVTPSQDLSRGISRVSSFKTKQELEKISSSLRVPFYVYELKDQLEKNDFMALINAFKDIEVSEVLEAEAAKFCKKKYNTEFDCIIDHIIQIG